VFGGASVEALFLEFDSRAPRGHRASYVSATRSSNGRPVGKGWCRPIFVGQKLPSISVDGLRSIP
jgi:hypothetical protein